MAKDLRNSAETQKKLLDAAGVLLVEEGLSGFGVNAIADRAGYGKPLLYRYFGDSHAVLNALAKSKANEVKAKLAGLQPPAKSQMSKIVYAQVMFARVLAGDAVLRALFLALLCGDLAVVAANALEDLVPRSGQGGDAGAAEAFLLSGIAYVLMLRDSRADCAGMPIKTPTDMAAFERAFVKLSSMNT
jgi:AcrR family transcriptional regulator